MTDINVPPRDFKVGDDVVCLNCDVGEVVEINVNSELPVVVKFKNISQAYTNDGKLFKASAKRCLFHADENVKVTVTEPVYRYQVLFKRKEFANFEISHSYYKSVEEFDSYLDKYESIELLLPSKRLVKNV